MCVIRQASCNRLSGRGKGPDESCLQWQFNSLPSDPLEHPVVTRGCSEVDESSWPSLPADMGHCNKLQLRKTNRKQTQNSLLVKSLNLFSISEMWSYWVSHRFFAFILWNIFENWVTSLCQGVSEEQLICFVVDHWWFALFMVSCSSWIHEQFQWKNTLAVLLMK